MKTFINKNRISKVVAFMLILIAPSFANAQSTDVSSDVRCDIEKLNKEMEVAIRANDMSKVVDLYTDEATIIIPGGQKVQGRKAIADYWYNVSRCKDFKSEITELGGNSKMVYQLSKWTMTIQKDGKAITYISDVIVVWKRQADWGYKIQLNSTNNEVAANTVALPVQSAEIKL